MTNTEIINLIEHMVIAHHESEMLWFGYAKDAEDQKSEALYKKFAVEEYHKESALCEVLDKITGIEGHGVLLDENCEYEIRIVI